MAHTPVGHDNKGQAGEPGAGVTIDRSIIGWIRPGRFRAREPKGRVVKVILLTRRRMRFGKGPISHQMQLVPEIRVLMKETPRPKIHLIPEKQAGYYFVADVLRTFQKLGYGPHFGISGISK